MKQRTIGVRELKAKLSEYLSEVKSGRTIVITERGKPVGRLTPLSESLEERLAELARTGNYTWNGKKLRTAKPLNVRMRGRKTLSDVVLENRD